MKKIWCSDAEKMQPGMERAEHFKNCDKCQERHKESWKKTSVKIIKKPKELRLPSFVEDYHPRRYKKYTNKYYGTKDEDEHDDR